MSGFWAIEKADKEPLEGRAVWSPGCLQVMITHKMKAGLLEDLATAQFFPSIEPPMPPKAVVMGGGQEEHHASHAWECPWQSQAMPGPSDKP